MPRPSISIPSSIPALALIMGLCGGLVGPAVAQQTTGPDRAVDALSQAQLDRIEAKLDALLQRLGTGLDAGSAVPSEETGLANAPRHPPLAGHQLQEWKPLRSPPVRSMDRRPRPLLSLRLFRPTPTATGPALSP